MKRMITMALLSVAACVLLSTPLEAQCCRRSSRGASAAGFFAGALAGAAIAGSYDSCPPPYYYGYAPYPCYPYDYPNPWYGYRRTTWGIYPYGY